MTLTKETTVTNVVMTVLAVVVAIATCSDGGRSFGHRVHATTVCTAPKYVFFKYLYLNNYKSSLCKNLNIAFYKTKL